MATASLVPTSKIFPASPKSATWIKARTGVIVASSQQQILRRRVLLLKTAVAILQLKEAPISEAREVEVGSEGKAQNIIPWAKHLVCSPRVRESDAGALTLRLIFRKYVLDLGWIIKVSTNVCCRRECESIDGLYQNSKTKYPVIEYIKSLIHWLDASVAEGERDLSEACKKSFVHGVLLALRYTFEELDWDSNVVLSVSEMRKELEKRLKLVTRITTLALWVVSADALCLPEDMDDIIDDDSFLSNVQDDDAAVLSEERKSTYPKPVNETIQSVQVVMVGCWLAMKEVSLLLGTIIRKILLPTSSLRPLENGDTTSAFPNDSVKGNSESLLDLKQLEKIGDHFLEVDTLLRVHFRKRGMKVNKKGDEAKESETERCAGLNAKDKKNVTEEEEARIRERMPQDSCANDKA